MKFKIMLIALLIGSNFMLVGCGNSHYEENSSPKATKPQITVNKDGLKKQIEYNKQREEQMARMAQSNNNAYDYYDDNEDVGYDDGYDKGLEDGEDEEGDYAPEYEDNDDYMSGYDDGYRDGEENKEEQEFEEGLDDEDEAVEEEKEYRGR